MRPHGFWWLILSGAIGTTVADAAPARAQTLPTEAKAPASAATTATPGRDVAEVYKQAVAAFKKGDYASAHSGFIEVWSQEKKPKVAGNLGRTELKLGKYCDAAEHLGLFLRDQPGLTPSEQKELGAQLDEARGKVVMLRVETAQPGADVFVDGARVGTAPLGHALCLQPGKHKIEARLGELRTAEDVNEPAGATATKKLAFAPPKTAGTGGGEPTGGAPGSGNSTPFPTRTLVLAGAGLAAVAGGVLLGVGAAQKAEAQGNAPTDSTGTLTCSRRGGAFDRGSTRECDRMRSLTSTADVVWGVGIGALTLGGAAATAAAISWLMPEPEKTRDRSTSQVAPVVGPHGAGLVWHGSF